MKNENDKDVVQADDELSLDINLDDLELELGDFELDGDSADARPKESGSDELEDTLDALFDDVDADTTTEILEDDHTGPTSEHYDIELDDDEIVYDADETMVLSGDEIMDILDVADAEVEEAQDIIDLGMLIGEEEDDTSTDVASLEMDFELDEEDIVSLVDEDTTPLVMDELELTTEDVDSALLEAQEDEKADIIPIGVPIVVEDDQPVWIEPSAHDEEVFTTTVVRNTHTGMYHLKTNGAYSSNSWDTFNGAMGALYSDLLAYMEPYKQRLTAV